jgi:7-keto-8-aminopelargonate synthetase-like enzyme
METSQVLTTIAAIHEDARRRGLFFQTARDEELQGRTIRLGDRELVSFSSCSYLGLERHRAVIDGVHDAVERYGVQFSCSRGYVSAPIYEELERDLSTLFGAHALVTPSTTMAHMIALPVLATEKDAIVLDHQAHHSIHMGANQARAGGATVEMVRHDQLERACAVVERLARKCKTVWFATDGVFSMYGDLAPLQTLEQILAVAPNVRLYVDDAHGMSWAGEHGRGSFLSRFPMSDRLVLATSFAKGFGAGGGCLVFSRESEREKVRLSGGPLVFSGPMQPPMMGAVLASARLHLSDEILPMQEAFRARTDHVNQRLIEKGIAPIAVNESPIFFLSCGLPRVAFEVAERMANDGVYVNCSVYPTVPMQRAGIRFTITAAHSFAELDHAIDRLAVHLPAVREEEGIGEAELRTRFDHALPAESAGRVTAKRPLLTVESHSTIRTVDRTLWNALLGTGANCSWDAMAAVEAVYCADNPLPEHRWSIKYLLVRDARNRVVAATFLTTHLHKDDMMSREEVSREVQRRRESDPYFLTSTVVQLGCNLSEGTHLYLDRSGPWKEALALVLAAAEAEVDRAEASALIVRDLVDGDVELDAFMLDQGLSRVPNLDTHIVDLAQEDEETWFSALKRKPRQQLRDVKATADEFVVTFHGHGLEPMPAADAAYLHELYRTLAERKLRLNVFAFPSNLIPELLDCSAWEIATIRLPPEKGGPVDGRPIAFWAAHKEGAHYAPLFCGFDEPYIASHNAYRQMLWQIVRRGRALGASAVHLGMDAEIEKYRFGARKIPTCFYARANEHYAAAELREIAAEVSVRAAGAR